MNSLKNDKLKYKIKIVHDDGVYEDIYVDDGLGLLTEMLSHLEIDFVTHCEVSINKGD